MKRRKGRVGSSFDDFLKEEGIYDEVDSRASRMIQMADLVAWSTFRKHEHKDGRFFDPIIRLFDADGGVLHGLVHHRSHSEECYCPACFSRAKRGAAARISILREH
jgi:hypothetical protein